MMDSYFTLDWAVDFIANRTRELREHKGVSAQTMSIELGQNVAYINKIENKTAKPSIEGLYSICDYLGVTFHDFFNEQAEHIDLVKELLSLTEGLKRDQLQILIETAKQFAGQ